jgi:hypothetical protein
MKQNFIGFADSDKFLSAIDKSRPVNLMVGRKNGRADRKYGMAIDCTVLTMSQAKDGEVLYFEYVAHKYQTLHGEIFNCDKERPARLGEQVMKAAGQYLDDHGIAWREALLSMPMNYITMNGEPTFLKWDKEEGYSYKAEVSL